LEELKESASRLTYSFGPFHLDPTERRLLRDGGDLRLSPKVFETLVLLVERHGLLVDKDELMKKLWPRMFVEEVTLARNISLLRKVLGDTPGQDQSQYIETVSKRGYRFIAKVTEIDPQKVDAAEAPEINTATIAPLQSSKWWQNPQAWIAVSAVVLLLAGLGAYWWFRVHEPPIRSIAVLPLENLSGDPNQEYFADGMTDDLITNLAQIHSLRVISRTSVMQFKHTKKTLPEIAAALNVDAIVEGSVARHGNDVHVTAQLLNARPERHLWAATYERQMSDIFGLQTQVAKAIADQVRANLTHDEAARLAKHHLRNPEAYDAYLRGRFIETRKFAAPAGKAVSYFQQAVAIDPDFAEAWAELGNSYATFGDTKQGEDREAIHLKARAAIAKALELDPNLSEAYASSAWVKMEYEWDWAGAEQDLKHAIELNPNNSEAHRYYSHYFMLNRRFDEALEENRIAVELAPFDVLVFAHLAWLYTAEDKPDKVIEECKRVLEMDPDHTGVYGRLALAYIRKGQWSEAIAIFDHLRELHPTSEIGYQANMAFVWAAQGDKRKAEEAMAKIREFFKDKPAPKFMYASYEAMYGDRDQALQWLEKAYQEREPWLNSLKIEHNFDNLRSDPRFKDLEWRIGFR
jgi:TolB-like protein/DNA-binding winged helix-turn-helix (wHTH) protein/Tfp pilus assembly protein PilF